MSNYKSSIIAKVDAAIEALGALRAALVASPEEVLDSSVLRERRIKASEELWKTPLGTRREG